MYRPSDIIGHFLWYICIGSCHPLANITFLFGSLLFYLHRAPSVCYSLSSMVKCNVIIFYLRAHGGIVRCQDGDKEHKKAHPPAKSKVARTSQQGGALVQSAERGGEKPRSYKQPAQPVTATPE